MNHPDPKKHQIISFVKSGVRCASSATTVLFAFSNPMLAIIILAAGYGLAELIGIYEELV